MGSIGTHSIPALAMISIAAPAIAQDGVGAMGGEWNVDLRLSLEDAPYNQPMLIEIAEDGTVSGSFYGSPIETGRAGEAQDRQCVFFRTSDGSGPYQTAACLVGDKMIGQTWSEGRDFVLPWTAERN